jgi:DNA-binding NarL/FixJ family response regulator
VRVVIVEDDLAMQKELTRTVQALSGEVVMAADAAPQAIQWLQSHPDDWDLAVVDMFLKQGHGFDVLRRCAARRPHQRAVMLSNYGRREVADYVRHAGADRFFDKSHDLDAFVSYCRGVSADLAACRKARADGG